MKNFILIFFLSTASFANENPINISANLNQETTQNLNDFDDGLLNNGDFEDGSTSWIEGVIDTNAAPVVTDSEGNKHYSKNVTSAGEVYTVNLSQKLPIAQGKMYEFTFDAWSDRERDMVVGLGLSASPWTNVQELVNFDTERKTFTFWLSSATFSGSTCRVFFDLGGSVGLVNIDNVSLKEITCPNPSFTTSDATYDGVSFTWNTNPAIDSYTAEISYDYYTPGDGTATSYVFSDSEPQPYVITGLEDGTKYFISIKSNCGGDSYSAPIGPNYLFTLWDEVVDCPEVISPPYFNDFGKEVPFGWSSLPMDKPRAEFLECNTLIDADAEQITESSDSWGLFADNFSSGVDNVFAISFSYDLNQSVGLNVDNYVAIGPVDLTNASSAELKWKVRSYSDEYFQENYTVYISDTDEVSDILASNTTFNERLTSSDVGQWNQRSLDLIDVGKLVYVVFRHHDSYDHYFIGLDDIEITSETLSSKEFNINLSYYFDRATKSLELEALSHIKEVSIYDMNARLINLENPNTLKTNIDFNYIPKGLYIVKAKTDQDLRVLKS